MNKQDIVNELLDFVVKQWDGGYVTSYETALGFVKDYADYHGVKVDIVEVRKKWRDYYGLTDS